MKSSYLHLIIFILLTFGNVNISKSQTLYAISQRTSDFVNFLSEVNPLNGSTTLISNVGLGQFLAQGISTIDPINKRFFFLSFDTLFTVDLTTGNLISKNTSSLAGTYSNYAFEFDCQDTVLYAISQRNSDNMNFLSKVDPLTGNTTLISTTGLGQFLAQGISTIDPINKRLFYLSFDTLNTVDLYSGNSIAKNTSSVAGMYSNYLFEFDKNCLDSLPGWGIKMPNIFTPNNDGINDKYIPIDYHGINKANLKIINRRGEELFYTDDLLSGWDGSYKGNFCQDGIYYWFIQYTTQTNKVKEKKGFLMIIK